MALAFFPWKKKDQRIVKQCGKICCNQEYSGTTTWKQWQPVPTGELLLIAPIKGIKTSDKKLGVFKALKLTQDKGVVKW